jgi:hypothetical protein
LDKSHSIILVNKSNEEFQFIKAEIRKNHPVLISLVNAENKLVYYSLDTLTKVFKSVVENSELRVKLLEFYTVKNSEIELEKIRLQQEKEEKERKILDAKKAEYRLKLDKSIAAHKSFLLSNKIEYVGYKKPERLRQSHCYNYNCRATVSSKANYECAGCNALICLCGKCLCVWNRDNKT